VRSMRSVAAIIGVAALFVVGCDAGKGSEADASSQELADEDAARADDPSGERDQDGAEDLSDAPSSDGDDAETANSADFASELVCDEEFTGPEIDLEPYTELYGDVNFGLETLASAFGSDFTAFQAGDLSEADFGARLEEHGHTYSEVTAPALESGAPAAAADWHAMAVESWNEVCQAIANAHEGLINGDDTQLAEVDEAVSGSPNLINRLHANTMVAPGEIA